MSPVNIETLNKIIELDGDCLSWPLCNDCPFKTSCLPSFIKGVGPSKKERLMLAADTLANQVILGDSNFSF